MAVVSVGEIWQRRRSAYRDSKLTHDLMYLVTCDNGSDGTATAIGADGIPASGDAFVDVYGNVAYLNQLDCQPRNGADRVFEIQAEFVTLDPSQPDDNPLNQVPTFAWSYQESTEPYFIDESTNGQNGDGVPVVNAAGDTFETLPTRDRGDLVITMGVNAATHDAAAADTYSNTTNQAEIELDGTTYAAGTLRLKPISAVKQTKTLRSGSPVTYYAKTLTFLARHQGWHDAPLNIGYSELVGDKTKNSQSIRRIVDANGNPVTKPWPLDPSGAKLPNATDPPQALDFIPYKPADWTNVITV